MILKLILNTFLVKTSFQILFSISFQIPPFENTFELPLNALSNPFSNSFSTSSQIHFNFFSIHPQNIFQIHFKLFSNSIPNSLQIFLQVFSKFNLTSFLKSFINHSEYLFTTHFRSTFQRLSNLSRNSINDLFKTFLKALSNLF